MLNKAEKISDAELEVLKVLWTKKEPMTERQIVEVLGQESGWHRATIQTLLRRLCEKDAVRKDKKVVFFFSPVISETEYAKERTSDLLNKIYGGSAKNLISAMLSDNTLSEEDIDDLKKYWQRRRTEK